MKRNVRKIVVDAVLWVYKIGKSNVTAMCVSTGERRTVDFSTLTGKDWNEIERGQWKRYFHTRPSHIAKWLSNKDVCHVKV